MFVNQFIRYSITAYLISVHVFDYEKVSFHVWVLVAFILNELLIYILKDDSKQLDSNISKEVKNDKVIFKDDKVLFSFDNNAKQTKNETVHVVVNDNRQRKLIFLKQDKDVIEIKVQNE